HGIIWSDTVAIIPFIGDINSFPLRLTDSSGISRAYRTIGEIAGLGDTDYSAVIGWHEGEHNWSFGLTGFAPTGFLSGEELHFEWALNQHFPFGLAAGIGGYFYQQVTKDYGSGDTIGSNIGRSVAIGPLLSYALTADTQEVDISGRWYHEFAVINGHRGDVIYATLSFRM